MAVIARPVLVRNTLRSRCIYRPQHLVIHKRFKTLQTSPPTPSTEPSKPSRSYVSRIFGASALFVLATTAGLAMSVVPAAETVNGLLAPPTNAETLTMYQPTSPKAQEINKRIQTSALAECLRADPSYSESRPHLKIPESMRAHNLTGGTLQGEDKLGAPPLTFASTKAALPSIVQITHLGPSLCGHPGIIHGGLLATLLDEGLGRACFPALPNKVAVTASLTMTYKKPCPADSYVVLRAETTKVEGRKAWVRGWIELLGDGVDEGEHLVEAEALFIEPRGAKNMAKLYTNDE